MSARLISTIFSAHHAFRYSGSELAVMLRLAYFADDDGRNIYPSVARVARDTRLSESQARRTVRKLVRDGWLAEVGQRRVPGRNFYVNEYRIAVDRLVATPGADATPSTDARGSTDAHSPLVPMQDDPSKDPSIDPPKSPTNANKQSGGKKSAQRARREKVRITTFLDNCKATGDQPIPEGDPVFKYADAVELPREWLWLAWREFVERSRENGKRYKDWRLAFRNCVRDNWYRLWWVDSDRNYRLTTQGLQAEKLHKEQVA